MPLKMLEQMLQTDIIFLQKREEMRTDNFPEWVDIDEYAEGININKYFISAS